MVAALTRGAPGRPAAVRTARAAWARRPLRATAPPGADRAARLACGVASPSTAADAEGWMDGQNGNIM